MLIIKVFKAVIRINHILLADPDPSNTDSPYNWIELKMSKMKYINKASDSKISRLEWHFF